jgi:hypothetical protein
VSASLVAAAILAGAPQADAARVLEVGQDGRATVRLDPTIPAESPIERPRPAPAVTPGFDQGPVAAAAGASRLEGAVNAAAASGAISAATRSEYLRVVARARSTAARLGGSRRAAINAVISNFSRMTLTASRLRPAIETVRRNAQWFGSNGAGGWGGRVTFRDSWLVWQFYPGQGLQVQWLGSFGRLNGLYLSKSRDSKIRSMAREMSSMAVERAGGVAWEYMFRFGGGRPPWVSAISQGTALQALSRAGHDLKEREFLRVADRALGIFRTAPPSGVRVRTSRGAHYLAYSYAPGQRIYNQFFQGLIGLHTYAKIADDGGARRLFLEGEKQARAEVRQSDTGSWSLYQPGEYSTVEYHKLLRDFVRGLCDRLRQDRERAAMDLREKKGPDAVLEDFADFPDPEPYCITTQRFYNYLYKRLGRWNPN